MLATLVEQPFDRPDWIFEMKWDGYRALAEIENHKVKLYSRNFQSFNKHFPPIVKDLENLVGQTLLDGEIVLLDENNRPSFQLIQNYQRDKREPLIYYVFDILYLNGYDLRHLPLLKRKEILKKFLPDLPHIKYCEHIKEQGIKIFKEALKYGYEGIIAKDTRSPYRQGRSKEWLKIKTHFRQEAIICGFTKPKGSRQNFGALILGVYDRGKLVYVGHTGSGFSRAKLAEIHARLLPLIQKESSFENPPKTNSLVTWVRPELVCEIAFAEWTREGQMRQAIFVDFREDKQSEEVVREHTLSVQQALDLKSTGENLKNNMRKKDKLKNQSQKSYLDLTHLDKIYWPEEGYTKGELIEYYREISSYILPYLKDRPETLHRYPNGIEAPSFFQKEVENAPHWLRTEKIKHEDRIVNYAFIEDEESLLYMVNLGCIELNPFTARIQSLNYPDYMVLDLDPEQVNFDQVIEVAQGIHQVLVSLGAESVCKTSGKRGLHIYIPLKGQYTFEQSRRFGELIAHLVHHQLPDLTSLERSPSKRQKKVYIDFLQNNFAQTVVAPYSARPTAGATVSTPLKWNEVKKGLRPAAFTIKTMLKRLNKVGDLFKPAIEKSVDLEKCLKRLEKQQVG